MMQCLMSLFLGCLLHNTTLAFVQVGCLPCHCLLSVLFLVCSLKLQRTSCSYGHFNYFLIISLSFLSCVNNSLFSFQGMHWYIFTFSKGTCRLGWWLVLEGLVVVVMYSVPTFNGISNSYLSIFL